MASHHYSWNFFPGREESLCEVILSESKIISHYCLIAHYCHPRWPRCHMVSSSPQQQEVGCHHSKWGNGSYFSRCFSWCWPIVPHPLGSGTSFRAHIHGEVSQHCSLGEHLPRVQQLYREELYSNSTSLCLLKGNLNPATFFPIVWNLWHFYFRWV